MIFFHGEVPHFSRGEAFFPGAQVPGGAGGRRRLSGPGHGQGAGASGA